MAEETAKKPEPEPEEWVDSGEGAAESPAEDPPTATIERKL